MPKDAINDDPKIKLSSHIQISSNNSIDDVTTNKSSSELKERPFD